MYNKTLFNSTGFPSVDLLQDARFHYYCINVRMCVYILALSPDVLIFRLYRIQCKRGKVCACVFWHLNQQSRIPEINVYVCLLLHRCLQNERVSGWCHNDFKETEMMMMMAMTMTVKALSWIGTMRYYSSIHDMPLLTHPVSNMSSEAKSSDIEFS